MDIVEVADGQLIEPPLTVEQRLAEHCAYSEATFTNGDYFHLLAKDALALIASQARRIEELEKGLNWIKSEMDALVNGSHPDYQIPHYIHDGKGGEEAHEPDDSVMIDRVCDAVSGHIRSLLNRTGEG